MKILFLAPYPPKESPSQRYRFEHYLPYLTEKDIDYQYHSFLDISTWTIFFSPGQAGKKIAGVILGFLRRSLLMLKIGRFDFVYVHREAAPLGPPVFEWLIAKIYRKRMIYDFDDAIWIPAASEFNRFATSIKWFSKVSTICRWSYKITPGNDFLAAFARRYNPRVEIIPTVVDTERVHQFTQDQSTDHPVIGWTGTFSTLKYLDLILPVLQRLEERYEFTFLVIADRDPALPLKRYRFVKWDKRREAEDLLQMHIGVMPLDDNDYAKGKCGFKAIQYMALGIPAVVSPVGVNSIIVDDRLNGFICDSAEDWEKRLEELLLHSQLRQEMGKEARKKIELNYSVKATKERFLELFS